MAPKPQLCGFLSRHPIHKNMDKKLTHKEFLEVGTKRRTDGNKEKAARAFAGAYKDYSLFWALKIGLIKGSGKNNQRNTRLEELVATLADCCNE